MTRRTLTTRIVVATSLIALSAVLAAAIWLGSSHGLEWAKRQVMRAGGAVVTLQGVEGSLLGEVRIARLTVAGGDFALDAETLAVSWQPLALLRGEIRLDRASASTLRYQSRSNTLSKLPDSLTLPLDLSIAALEIRRLEFGELPAIENLRIAYSGGRLDHDIRLLQIQAAGWTIDGGLRIDAQAPHALNGRLQARSGTTVDALQTTAIISGRIEELQIDVAGGGRGASIKAAAVLQPFSAQPVLKFSAQASELDLSTWNITLPRTRLTVDATAQSANTTLNGTLRAENAMPGILNGGRLPLAAASTRFSGSGRQWALREIDLQFAGGGRASGGATLRDDHAVIDMQLRNLDPARIDSRMQSVKISGQARLSGTTNQQQLGARLEGAGLRLQIAARHTDNTLSIDSAQLQARDGSAEISGQLGLTGKRAFALSGHLNRLDLSRLAKVPAALLNGRIAANGTLQPDWQAQVHIELADSRLRGLPFSASADFLASSAHWFDGAAQAAVGRNRAQINGRYGQPQDQLAWSVDAENLRALDPSFGGQLSGRGSVNGSVDGPTLDFNISGQQLAMGRHRVMRVEAQGKLAAGLDGALQFSADASGLQIAQTRIDTLRLTGNGSRARHVLEASAKGPDTNAALRAAGGIDPQARWVGTLEQLEMGQPWPLRLNAPAQITAGRDLLIIDQLRGTLLDGEFGPLALRAEMGRINTQGTFRGIGIGRLLPRDSGLEAGNLRFGGQWSLTLDEVWAGTASLYRESGDLALKGETPVPMALRKASLNLSAAAGAIDLALDIDSAAMGTAVAQLQTRMIRHNGVWLLPGEAPLTGSAKLDFRSLAWLRALAPDMDRIDGRLAVQLRADGTVAAPRLAGTITGDRIMLRAVGAGLDLRDGRLRATLDGTQFRLDEFELKAGKGRITASGSAELAGGLQSVELLARAEHAQILLAPQWSAIIDGSGRLGLRNRRVTLEGKFSLDEGRYDVGAKYKPTLGDDVIVRSGKTVPAEKAATLPVELDLSIDLKDKLTVRGNGLDALLGGSLRVTSRGSGLSAIGDVRTIRGYYSVFGQQLNIERGTLAFAGPLNNPGLDLRAIRKIQTVEVGVEVAGSLQRPEVKLVSTPDMSDTDRMTWLALGRDPQGTDRAQLAILQAMALSLSSGGGTSMQRQIAEGFGLDEVGFTSSENGALGAVALGKKLTDQLSIRLEQTLGGTGGSLLRMDYFLSDRWRLRATAGAENAGDILFTLRFD